MKSYRTKNSGETAKLAKNIARKLKGGDILLLEGELGAGKTTFVRALAKALGVSARIKSPTFTLMHVHRVRLKTKVLGLKFLIHCDAYRIKNAGELRDVGLMEYVSRPDTLVVVEWGEKVRSLAKKARRVWNIKFLHGKKETERVIQISKR